MGGFNEDVISGENKGGVVVEDILQGQKTNRSQSSLQLIPDQVQTVRHHVSGKNVHFHVDDENLKLSIPVAQLMVYFECLRDLSSQRKMYHDVKNKTMGSFEVGMNRGGQLDIVVQISPCEEGPVIQKLEKLMTIK